MITSFFSSLNKPKASILSTKIIEKLTRIRLTNYSSISINKLSEKDYSLISSLIHMLGEEILKSNRLENPRLTNFNGVKKRLTQTFTRFMTSGNKFTITFYAAQLLQYYTLLCSEDFFPHENYRAFINFLAENNTKLGDSSANPFILEYKLIKIYNELGLLAEQNNDHSNQSDLFFFQEHLQQLQEIITRYAQVSPDNSFAQYLNFVVHYTNAKALELQFKLLEASPSPTPEQLDLSAAQQAHLKKAHEALNKIEQLTEYFTERQEFLKGIEFCLGQELFYKLPFSHVDDIKNHLASLSSQ